MKDPQSWIQIGGQAMSDRPKITPAENGPLLVEGVATMTSYGDGSIVDVGGKKALCRCGGSANKPFCDGTHATNGFQSARGEGRTSDRLEHYEGKGIVIHDNRGICSHAGHCTDALKSVFKLGEEPWIDPDGASAQEIKEAIESCPSGALSYTIEGDAPSDWSGPTAQAFAPNGPYVFTGGVDIEGVDLAEGASREHVTLCRCGASQNKPYCDGSHWNHAFDESTP